MKKLAVIILITLFSLPGAQAKGQHRRPKVTAEKFAQHIFNKMLKKRKFKLAKDDSTSLKFNSEEFTYSKKLTFKTKRGYYCQGEMAFEVDLDQRVEPDTIFTNLSCYNTSPNSKSKNRRKNRTKRRS